MAPAEGGERLQNPTSSPQTTSSSPSSSSPSSSPRASSWDDNGGRHYNKNPPPFPSTAAALPFIGGRNPYLGDGAFEALQYVQQSPYLPTAYDYHAALLHHRSHPYGTYLPAPGYSAPYDPQYAPLSPTQMLGWATDIRLLDASRASMMRGISSEVETSCSASSSADTASVVAEPTGPVEGSKKRVRLSHEERLQRSRERNRVHARKTRKRKKHQMETIQLQIEQLHEEARRLRLSIMEWYTANILLVMRGPQSGSCQPAEDSSLYSKYMAVQAYLDRYNAEVKQKQEGEGKDRDVKREDGENAAPPSEASEMKSESGTSECDPLVTGPKGRSRYAPEDRERIRRERNRIHAKRTRDRRKKFMEDSEKVLAKLTRDNEELRSLVGQIYQSKEMMPPHLQPQGGDGEELHQLPRPYHAPDPSRSQHVEEEEDDEDEDDAPRRSVIKRPKYDPDEVEQSEDDEEEEEECGRENAGKDDVNSSPVRLGVAAKRYGRVARTVCV